jgi:hypothetical protein
MVHPHITLLKNRAENNKSQRSQQRGTLDKSHGTFHYNATNQGNGFVFKANRGYEVAFTNNLNKHRRKYGSQWTGWISTHGVPTTIVYSNLPVHSTPQKKKMKMKILPRTPYKNH